MPMTTREKRITGDCCFLKELPSSYGALTTCYYLFLSVNFFRLLLPLFTLNYARIMSELAGGWVGRF